MVRIKIKQHKRKSSNKIRVNNDYDVFHFIVSNIKYKRIYLFR